MPQPAASPEPNVHVSTLGSFSTTKHERLDGTDAAQFGAFQQEEDGDSVSVSCWSSILLCGLKTTCCYQTGRPRHDGYSEASSQSLPRSPIWRLTKRRLRWRIQPCTKRLSDSCNSYQGRDSPVDAAGLYRPVAGYPSRTEWLGASYQKQFQRLHRTMQRRADRIIFEREIFKRDFE